MYETSQSAWGGIGEVTQLRKAKNDVLSGISARLQSHSLQPGHCKT